MSQVEQQIAALRQQAAEQGKKKATAETQAATAEGRQEAASAALKDEFGITDIATARELAGKLEAALERKADETRGLLARAGGA